MLCIYLAAIYAKLYLICCHSVATRSPEDGPASLDLVKACVMSAHAYTVAQVLNANNAHHIPL